MNDVIKHLENALMRVREDIQREDERIDYARECLAQANKNLAVLVARRIELSKAINLLATAK